MQGNTIKPGQKVLIVDDLLATGGTMNAACELVQMAGGIVSEIVVVMELKSLNARKTIPIDKIFSLIEYDWFLYAAMLDSTIFAFDFIALLLFIFIV